MAGDWIKVEHATLDKPEIAIAAEHLGISDGEAFFLFMRYWVWLDQNLDESRHGLVPFVSRKSLERKFKCPGFAAILERIGWAQFDDEQQILTVINWEHHSGNTAKSRAVDQKRKAKQRSEASRFCPENGGTKTGLEKRREELNTNTGAQPAAVSPLPVDNSKANGKGQKRRQGSEIAADFAISERVRTWAAEKGYGELGPYYEAFKGRNEASGKRYVDWDAAFMNAIREDWYELRSLKKRGNGNSWWATEEATTAMATSLGMTASPRESWAEFRTRISDKLREKRP